MAFLIKAEREKVLGFFPMNRIRVILGAGLFIVFLSACGQVEPGKESGLGVLDHDLFKSAVQPVLDQRNCSDAGCHQRDKSAPNTGGPGGSFRLFECRAFPCTALELQANHDSAEGMANLVNPDDSRLLTKPLTLAEGGIQHLGGNIFLSVTDADYLTMLAWIQSPL